MLDPIVLLIEINEHLQVKEMREIIKNVDQLEKIPQSDYQT